MFLKLPGQLRNIRFELFLSQLTLKDTYVRLNLVSDNEAADRPFVLWVFKRLIHRRFKNTSLLWLTFY